MSYDTEIELRRCDCTSAVGDGHWYVDPATQHFIRVRRVFARAVHHPNLTAFHGMRYWFVAQMNLYCRLFCN